MRNKLNITTSNSIPESLDVTDDVKIKKVVEKSLGQTDSVTEAIKIVWEDASISDQEAIYAIMLISACVIILSGEVEILG